MASLTVEDEIIALLPPNLVGEKAPPFGPLLWHADKTLAEFRGPPGAVIVDSPVSQRRAIVMQVRDEVRVWLTVDRAEPVDPRVAVVSSAADALRILDEFLRQERQFEELTTSCVSHREMRKRFADKGSERGSL